MPSVDGPLVSVITINLNNAGGLQKTIDSVGAQSFPGFEYIVIDGGSTDGSLDVIRSNESLITRWVSEKDSGIADAFNKGLRLARGKWINFLNSGDYFLASTILASIAPLLVGTGIVSGQSSTNGSVSPMYPARNEHGLPRRAWLSHQASFVHRRVFEECGEFDTGFRICMDYEFWLRALPKADLRFVERPLVEFAPNGISSRERDNCFKEACRANRLRLPRAGLINLRMRLRGYLHAFLCFTGTFETYRRLRLGVSGPSGV